MTLSLPQWRIVGASVIGVQHARLGGACEDALGSISLPGGSIACAVADGAGSASAGKAGAQTAVATALARVAEIVATVDIEQSRDFYLDMLQQILQAIRNALLEECVRCSQTLSDFATTLLFVFVTPQWLVALQIGDGAIVARRSDDSVETVTVPHHEEYINETHFVTDANYLAVAQYVVERVDDINGIAMLTDGLQMLALEVATHKAYGPFFLPLFTFASQQKEVVELTKELENFLATDRVSQRTDDDKTLLLAVAAHFI